MTVAAILAAATVCGLYIFWPKVSIEPYASTNPHEPFAQLFYVHNESIYPIYEVQPNCGAGEVSTVGPSFHGFTLLNPAEFVATLGSDERTTFRCALVGGSSAYGTMDISPSVWFDLPFGFHQCKERHFSGVRAWDGAYIWTWRGGGNCPIRKN
jgi:hypothetical protein